MPDSLKKMNARTRRCAFIATGLILFVALSIWLYTMLWGFASIQNRYAFADIGHNAVSSTKTNASFEDSNLYARVDFDQVPRSAESWIYIPGCDVDVPLVKEQSVGSNFYQSHDVNGDANLVGCVAERGSLNGKTGAFRLVTATASGALSDLPKYFPNLKSACAHPYMYEYTDDSVTRYRLWAAAEVPCDDTITRKYPVAVGSEEYSDFLSTIDANAKAVLFQKPSIYQDTFVISTEDDKNRFLLVYVADKKLDYAHERLSSAADANVLYHWMCACEEARCVSTDEGE